MFMDRLARMMGRLLKGGEPDLDSVAKIMLSDWVRGRIPFFVPPPERPEELNRAEAKKSKKKGKEAEKKEKPVMSVVQNFGSIMQKNSFLEEDVRTIEENTVEGKNENEDGVNEDGIDKEVDETGSLTNDVVEDGEVATAADDTIECEQGIFVPFDVFMKLRLMVYRCLTGQRIGGATRQEGKTYENQQGMYIRFSQQYCELA